MEKEIFEDEPTNFQLVESITKPSSTLLVSDQEEINEEAESPETSRFFEKAKQTLTDYEHTLFMSFCRDINLSRLKNHISFEGLENKFIYCHDVAIYAAHFHSNNKTIIIIILILYIHLNLMRKEVGQKLTELVPVTLLFPYFCG